MPYSCLWRRGVVSLATWLVRAMIFIVGISSTAYASEGLPQLDTSTYTPQLAWLVVVFLVLYLLLSRRLLPNIGKTIEARQSRISQDLELARQDLEEAKALGEQQTKKMEDARLEAQAVLNAAAQEIQVAGSEALESAVLKSNHLIEVELSKLEKEHSELLSNLEDTAVALVQDIVKGIGVSAVTKPFATQVVRDVISNRSIEMK